MIDMHAPLETVPTDGRPAIGLDPDYRYWPNPVSLDYCVRITDPATGRTDEHWYSEEGEPLDETSPTIRNVRQINVIDMRAAFLAGAGDADPAETERRYDAWLQNWAQAA